MNAGLTQVLSDGTNTYLYGNGRISQHATQTEYFLGDALGSVRQLADAAGAVTLTKSYAPYGDVSQSVGTSQTSYAFTGEARDANGLTYLRARYYNSGDGRFLSRDTWNGDYNRPLSLNRWGYVEGNPVNYTDPTGHIKQGREAEQAESVLMRLAPFGIVIKKDWGAYNIPYMAEDPMGINEEAPCGWDEGLWTVQELKWVEEAVKDLKRKLGGPDKIQSAVGQLIVNNVRIPGFGSMMSPPGVLNHVLGGDIVILQNSTDEYWYKFTFVHEFGHVWDYRTGNKLSHGLMEKLGSWRCVDPTGNIPCYWDPSQSIEHPPDTCANPYDTKCTNNHGDPYPYSSSYGNGGWIFTKPGAEDWANALGYHVYPAYRQPDVIGLKKIRNQYVKKQIANLP